MIDTAGVGARPQPYRLVPHDDVAGQAEGVYERVSEERAGATLMITELQYVSVSLVSPNKHPIRADSQVESGQTLFVKSNKKMRDCRGETLFTDLISWTISTSLFTSRR